MGGALKSIGSALVGVAPAIANVLLPGVGGVVANAAIGGISKALGLDPKATAQQIQDALGKPLSPEQMLALKQADRDFEVQMKELDVDMLRLHAEDRDSARKMQTKTRAIIVPVVAAVVLSGWLAINAYIAYAILTGYAVELNGESGIMLGNVIGGLGGAASTILAFYYGSSKKEAERKEVSDA